VAERIAGWPWSVVRVPEVPFPAYLAMVVGGAWLCLWRRRWRALGAVPIAVGVGLTLLHSGPDLLIDGEARLVALRGPDGLMALSDRRTSRLTAESWLRRAGRS
jgi:competence protein ComEC